MSSPARTTWSARPARPGDYTVDAFGKWLPMLLLSDVPVQFEGEQGGGTRARLAALPGFVAAKDAVTATTSKRDALATMARLDVSGLPVVDTAHKFVGTVDRSKMVASLILAVSDKVENRER